MDKVLREVPGALPTLDAYLFLELSRLQREAGVQGDLLEIGAAYGASAIMMERHRRSNERFVVCDLFGSPPVREDNLREQRDWGYDQLQRSVFENNFLRYYSSLPDIWQRASSTLEEAEVGQLRFAHVDGSHLYVNVCEDISFVRSRVATSHLVVFDDVFTGHAPGVGAAVWPEVASGLRPLLATSQKLYATWGESSIGVGDIIPILEKFGAQIFEDEIDGDTVIIARKRRVTAQGGRGRLTALARDLLPPIAARWIRRKTR